MGRHCVKAWSKTQAVIAKSSAESELYSVIKGSCEGLGMQTLMDDLGVTIDINLHLDATAAKGILERSGLSKVRHIDVNHLWLQEQCARKIIPLTKVDGTKNPSDLLTKHLSVAVIEKHLECLNLQYREGRSEKAAKLHTVAEKPKSVNKIGKMKRQEDSVIQQGVFNFEKCKNDDWAERGENEKWCRWHRNPRRALFTPFKVAGGPGGRTKLEPTRITEGIDELSRTIGGTQPSRTGCLTCHGWARPILKSIQLKTKNWEATVVVSEMEHSRTRMAINPTNNKSRDREFPGRTWWTPSRSAAEEVFYTDSFERALTSDASQRFLRSPCSSADVAGLVVGLC